MRGTSNSANLPSILISGPAGAGKSQEARRLLAASSEPTILVEFQEIYATILGIERLPSGRYPEREEKDSFGIPLTTEIRLGILAAAKAQQVAVIMTNSDGSPERRALLLSRLGPGATEIVVDPGIDVVTQRLSVNGTLSDQCRDAIQRWHGRLGTL